MKQEYLPTAYEGKVSHVVEECGEVLQIIGKIGRFGNLSTHPDRPDVTNVELLDDELADLEAAVKRLRDDSFFRAMLPAKLPEGVYGDGEYM